LSGGATAYSVAISAICSPALGYKRVAQCSIADATLRLISFMRASNHRSTMAAALVNDLSAVILLLFILRACDEIIPPEG
jgi:hypothetical protein